MCNQMQESEESPMLLDMLSSRSYLELSSEGQDKAETSINNPLSKEEPSGLKNGPERRLRPRTRRASKAQEVSNQVSEDSNSVAPGRPARKRGRPRLETAKDATAIEERRLQIRRAQRTYRLKKEVTIQTLKARVTALEETLDNISEILGGAHPNPADLLNSDAAGRANINYLASTRELILAEIDKTRFTDESENDSQPGQVDGPSGGMLGYQFSQAQEPTRPEKENTSLCSLYLPDRARSPTPLINRILPTTTIYTYSHQESNFSRRLHRFCLEHTYRWLTDPRTEPARLSRVFGLMPCIHDMPGIIRHFRRILQSEIGGNLEVAKMPYYALGGAGKHFPRVDADGHPVYPENIRSPGKVLRRMVCILQRGGIRNWDGNWSGDREPVPSSIDGWVDQVQEEIRKEEMIRSLDLDGEWFDCHDVQGYLQHRGLVLDGSALRLGVPDSLVGALYGASPNRSTVSSMYTSPEGAVPVERSESEPSTSSSYILDVECFFDLLLANLRVLGRAPGFRVWDVDAALRAAISRRPFV